MVDQNVVSEDVHLNLFGRVDEGKEREKRYQEVLARYPADTKTNCDQLEGMLKTIRSEIAGKEEQRVRSMASGGSGRPENRELYGLNKRRVELEGLYNNMRCAEIKEEVAAKAFNETQITNLERVSQISKDTGKATKYIVWGMLGVVVLVTTIVIIRKTRK
jgi:hypothetical protein